jgi:4-amino-4-deoxy-L-arabinose transferase-like glycosyltransferase
VNTSASRALPFLLLAAVAAAIFLIGLGRLPLFGRDEALYAESGREMLVSGDWVTPRVNDGPFLEKPPLLYWLDAISYRALGVSPFSARFPAALLAVLTVLLTASIGARVWGRRAGMLAGLTLVTSLQMAMIGRMGIMDVPLTCLTLLALLCYERWRSGAGLVGALSFGACIGLAVLLKGAAGLIAVLVASAHLVWMAIRRAPLGRSRAVSVGTGLLSAVTAIGIAAPWFAAMSARHGEAFGSTLLLHEHIKRILQPMQGHGGPLWIYLPLILFSFFPWVVFAPGGAVRCENEDERVEFWRTLCITWILCVLIPFSLIRTKLPGYVTPLFPPLALLAAVAIDRCPGRKPWMAVLGGAILFGIAVSLLPAAAARVGARVGAAQEASLLLPPTYLWVAGYVVIIAGAIYALRRVELDSSDSLPISAGLLTLGQITILAALLFGVLPVLSPYLGGGAARLARMAQQELPSSRIVLYDTYPETVNFALQRFVTTLDSRQQAELRAQLSDSPVALIAPAKDESFWKQLPARRTWRWGDRVLLDIPKQDNEEEAP